MGSIVAPAPDLAVTGWSVVSPLGIGAEPFAAGIRAGRIAVAPLDQREWPGPLSEAGLVPGFSVGGVLGRKGTRSMDRATGLAITAVGLLLEQENGDLVEAAKGPVGLVLGTNTGSIQSIMDFTRDSLTQDKPFYVDPARFPNTVMNCAAGQCAIWHGLKGPNTTIAGGSITGLLALSYATRLQRCGHVDTLLCGAVEEFSVQRSWLEWHAHAGERTGWPAGEGCAVFLLEPAAAARDHGREALAEVLALEFGAYHQETGIRDNLARCIRRALERAGSCVSDVWAIAPSESRGLLGEQECAAVEDVFGVAGPRRLGAVRLLGDTSAASAAFQLAVILATAQDLPEANGRAALVTSVDRDGMLGCALLRIPSHQIHRKFPTSKEGEIAMLDSFSAVLDKEELRRTIAEVLDADTSEVTDEANFVEDLAVDSLMGLEVMVVLEKKYHVKLTQSELREVTSLQRAYDLVAGKLRAS